MTRATKTQPVRRAKAETETLIALATSDTVTEAAKKLGISRQVVYERIHKYNLTEKLKSIQAVATVELATGAGKAARNLINKIDHEDPNISIKASTETLDRIGLTKADTGAPRGSVNIFNFGDKSKARKYVEPN